MQTKRIRALTARQETILLRVYRNRGHDWISPDIATQLIRRGLLEKTSKYQPADRGRLVTGATVWGVILTPAGRARARLTG